MAGKPTLIHLENSCSQSVLWLLEELGIEYDIRKYARPMTKEGTPELKETHIQGKSPQLLLPDGRVITQLNAVLLYLLHTYDAEQHRFSGRPGLDDPVRDEQLCCVGTCDLSARLATKFLFAVVVPLSPFFVRPILRTLGNTISRLSLDPDLANAFKFLEAELEGRDWFGGGEAPSRADFVLHFNVGLATQPKFVNLDEYPRVKAWMARCEERPAWKRSLELGNGYDLKFGVKV